MALEVTGPKLSYCQKRPCLFCLLLCDCFAFSLKNALFSPVITASSLKLRGPFKLLASERTLLGLRQNHGPNPQRGGREDTNSDDRRSQALNKNEAGWRVGRL